MGEKRDVTGFEKKSPKEIAWNIDESSKYKEKRKTGYVPHETEAKAIYEFAQCLGTLIQDNYDTAKAASIDLNIGPSNLSNYYSGNAEPGINTLYKIAKQFDVSADYLLGLSKSKRLNEDMIIACKTSHLSEIAISRLCEYAKNNLLGEHIQNHLIEHGHFSDIVDFIEDLIVRAYQFDFLYETEGENKQREFDSKRLAFEFTEFFTERYTTIASELMTERQPEIEAEALLQMEKLLKSAKDTRDKMDKLIDTLESDEYRLARVRRLVGRNLAK